MVTALDERLVGITMWGCSNKEHEGGIEAAWYDVWIDDVYVGNWCKSCVQQAQKAHKNIKVENIHPEPQERWA